MPGVEDAVFVRVLASTGMKAVALLVATVAAGWHYRRTGARPFALLAAGLALLLLVQVISGGYNLFYQQLMGPLTEESILRMASLSNAFGLFYRVTGLIAYVLFILALLRLRRDRAGGPQVG